ncbi:MAG: PAS domain S-box protein [Methanomassiliicoccus sp.]|nr:PAS domain S-box protein [Methanomassiliicoccus sp.]
MIHILYIDDEPALLEIGKVFLESCGKISVDTALSVKDAESLVQHNRYDCIISDYQMPVINGIEYLKILRSRGNSIPFILFTGKGREEVVIEALNAGADFYIQKGGQPEVRFRELQHQIDVTVQKRKAEENVIASNAKLRAAIDLANIGYWSFDVHAMTFSADSSHLRHIYGSDVNRGNGLEITFDRYIREIVHPEDVDMMVKIRDSILSLESNNGQGTYRIIRPDGTIRLILFTYTVVRDVNGKPLTVFGAAQDITEYKEKEAILKENEQDFKAFVDQCTDGILLLDDAGTIIQWNRSLEKITGLDADEVMGQSFWDVAQRILPDEERNSSIFESRKAAFIDLMKKGQADTVDNRVIRYIKRPDDQIKRLERTFFKITVGSHHRYGSIVRDVTEA